MRNHKFSSCFFPLSLSSHIYGLFLFDIGTPPTQFASTGAQSSSSPRVSVQSNTSPSHNNVTKEALPIGDNSTNNNTVDRKMSLTTRGRRPSMFDPIDPKELQQALYASAAVSSYLISLIRF